MRTLGIRGASRAKKHFTTKSDASHVRAPDLVKRNFTAARPDALWVADFTYCSTWSGIVYVAFIIDVYSRRLVGWKAARSMTTPLVLDALNMAAWTRRHTTLDGLICHTDAGSQLGFKGSLQHCFVRQSVEDHRVLRRESSNPGSCADAC
jgi:transposase InsO family protein